MEYFVWKITILCQKIIFFPILGGARTGCAPWICPCIGIGSIRPKSGSVRLDNQVKGILMNIMQCERWQHRLCDTGKTILTIPRIYIVLYKSLTILSIKWSLFMIYIFALYAFQFNLCFILVLSYFCMNILKYVLKVHEYFMCVLSWFAYLLNYRLLIICMNVLVCVICAINVGIYFLYWLLVLWQ
jgi:hypothetical protein